MSSIDWFLASGAILVGIGFIVAFVRGNMGRYRKIFAEAHIVEIAGGLPAIQEAAFARTGERAVVKGDPRALLTDGGLAIVYTVTRDGASFIHHVSLSMGGSITTGAVGQPFLLLVADLLGLPDTTGYGRARSTVHHAEVRLDATAHERLAEREVPSVDEEGARDRLRAARERARKVPWQAL